MNKTTAGFLSPTSGAFRSVRVRMLPSVTSVTPFDALLCPLPGSILGVISTMDGLLHHGNWCLNLEDLFSNNMNFSAPKESDIASAEEADLVMSGPGERTRVLRPIRVKNGK